MLQAIRGDYVDGKIQLAELPNVEKARVLVVFLDEPTDSASVVDDPGRDRGSVDE